jgi:wyosine [tRNA(Phe)-imidazoG37] synthetase (radical SAM superfamily)
LKKAKKQDPGNARDSFKKKAPLPYFALEASEDGEIWENSSYYAVGRTGLEFRLPRGDELSIEPFGTAFYFLPQRIPLGMQRSTRKMEPMHGGGKSPPLFAVGLIPPPGYTRTLLPAFKSRAESYLPFYAYSLGAFKDGQFHIAAVASEISPRWDPSQYNSIDLQKKIDKKMADMPGNRLLGHLARCAVEYGCYNAQNIFYGRWEGGIPLSGRCNAGCLGCISKQGNAEPPAPQERINFIPTKAEIVQIAVHHLDQGEAIVSFGQGCEGEPTMQAELLEDAVGEIRNKTSRGTLNINTNGSRPDILRRLAAKGLDSIRISLNSAIDEHYRAFFKPSGYSLQSVRESLRIGDECGIHISVNLFIMPGFTDSESVTRSLFDLFDRAQPRKIQLRNLNIDPDLFFKNMPAAGGKRMGIPAFIAAMKEKFRALKVGSHNPALRE